MRRPRAARFRSAWRNPCIGTKDFLRLEKLHRTIAVQGVINISRRRSSHAHGASWRSRSAIRHWSAPAAYSGVPARRRPHFFNRSCAAIFPSFKELEHVLTEKFGPIFRSLRYMARWTGSLLGRWTICLGVRWRLRLTLTAFTIKPSDAEISAGPCDVFTGAASTPTLSIIARTAPKLPPARL